MNVWERQADEAGVLHSASNVRSADHTREARYAEATFRLPRWLPKLDQRASDDEVRTPNIPDAVVNVVIDPNLSRLGELEFVSVNEGQTHYTARVRQWDPQVVLHELLHAVVDPIIPSDVTYPLPAPGGDLLCPLNHQVIGAVEVAFAGLFAEVLDARRAGCGATLADPKEARP